MGAYNSINAPIVLFVYNRPWHTQQTIEALQKNELAKQSDLIIYSDGPKNRSVQKDIEAVRNYINIISGFKSVKVIKRDKNWGLADSIVDGVTRVVNKHGKVIVIEDDIVTSPYFLKYMNDALTKYEDHNKVMQISGFTYKISIESEYDAFFLPFTSTWGWATWKTSWGNFDPSMKGYNLLKENKKMKNKFNLNGHYSYFHMLEDKKNAKNDTWGILWYLSVFCKKGLTLYPKQSLVNNIGFDGTGIHCNTKTKSPTQFKPLTFEFTDNISINNLIFNNILKTDEIFKKKLLWRFVDLIRNIFL